MTELRPLFTVFRQCKLSFNRLWLQLAAVVYAYVAAAVEQNKIQAPVHRMKPVLLVLAKEAADTGRPGCPAPA